MHEPRELLLIQELPSCSPYAGYGSVQAAPLEGPHI